MTTEIQAHIDHIRSFNVEETKECTMGEQFANILHENDDLRRRCERLRRERDELSLLIIQMRKRISDIMHSSLDTVNKV